MISWGFCDNTFLCKTCLHVVCHQPIAQKIKKPPYFIACKMTTWKRHKYTLCPLNGLCFQQSQADIARWATWRLQRLPAGRIVKLTQHWRYLNLLETAFTSSIPRKASVGYMQIISSTLYVRINQFQLFKELVHSLAEHF